MARIPSVIEPRSANGGQRGNMAGHHDGTMKPFAGASAVKHIIFIAVSI
jgi:hypothetical protein